MSKEEDEYGMDFQTSIMTNEKRTTVQITLSAKEPITGQVLIDIFEQLIEDYQEAPESILDTEQLTLN